MMRLLSRASSSAPQVAPARVAEAPVVGAVSTQLNDTRFYDLALSKLNEEKCLRLWHTSSEDLDPNIYHQCLAAVLLSKELLRIASDKIMRGIK